MGRQPNRGSDRRSGPTRREVLGTVPRATAGLAALSAAPATATATPTVTRPATDDPIWLGGRKSGWVGVEPPTVAGESNPTLRLVSGRRYTVRWENLDDAPHELVVVDDAGAAVARSPRRDGRGETAAVSFVATSDLRRYVCPVHRETMVGTVLVAPSAVAHRGGLVATTSGPGPADEADDLPSKATVHVSFDADGTADYRVELANLERVTQVNVRELTPVVAGPTLSSLVRFAESPDGRAGGEPVDAPADDPLVLTGVLRDEAAVDRLADDPDEYEVVVHTVDFPAGRLRGRFVAVDALYSSH